MLILDRYIIRQFLTNFVILLVVFMSLFFIGDLIIDLDEFVDAGAYYAKVHGGSPLFGTLLTIADYYGPQMIMIYVFFSGVLVVGAMGFTLSSLSKSRELVAMVASGINMYRIAMPILVVGAILNLLTIVSQEQIIPKLADKLTRDKSNIGEEHKQTTPIIFSPDSKGNLFSAAQFDMDRKQMDEVTIIARDGNGQAIQRVTATQAYWDDKRQGWDLTLGMSITRDSGDISDREARSIDFFPSDLSPTVIQARSKAIYPRLLSFQDLRGLRDNPAIDSDRIRRIMHSRFSLLVVNTLILAMGMPFFLRREPANMFVYAARAAMLCLGAWAAGLVLLQIGGASINPVIAAWLPVVIYLPLTAILMQLVKT